MPLATLAERVTTLEATVFGRDGRGGVVGEIDELTAKIDKLTLAMFSAAGTFTAATITIVAAILTHSL